VTARLLLVSPSLKEIKLVFMASKKAVLNSVVKFEKKERTARQRKMPETGIYKKEVNTYGK